MIYLDRIAYFEKEIIKAKNRIEKFQNKVNELWKLDKKGEFVKIYVREMERKQRFCKNKIEKYREEIRQLKSF